MIMPVKNTAKASLRTKFVCFTRPSSFNTGLFDLSEGNLAYELGKHGQIQM